MIAVISKGSLVELGTHSELLAQNGTYANLVAIQLGGRFDQNGANEQPQETIKEVHLFFIIYYSLGILTVGRRWKRTKLELWCKSTL